jgi:hypothetical protein
MSEKQLRQKLRRIGSRRRRLGVEEATLAEDTTEVLRLAKGVIPMEEAATLAGLSRSTVYEVYLREPIPE